jgi:hypothetical protein
LRKIAQEEPVPPRRLNPGVPKDLETILLKAMAKEASGRYATATDLADDLRRFLEDKPVLARRPALLDRAAKWSRRHGPAVWTAGVSVAVFLLMSVVGLAISNFLIARERDQRVDALKARDAALKTAKANEREARENLQLARKAVDKLYTRVADEFGELGPLLRLRRELLIEALEFYKTLAGQKSSDPQVRFEAGLAYRRVADIHHHFSEYIEAVQALRQGIPLLEKLVEEFPREVRYRGELDSHREMLRVLHVYCSKLEGGNGCLQEVDSGSP